MLLLTLPERAELQIGRTRRICFEPGLYCYAGSALGPGGLAARLKRHAAGCKRQHWHIDYLLPYACLLGALLHEEPQRLECKWAAWAHEHAQACTRSFGSSDCTCPGPLFFLGRADAGDRFAEQAGRDLGVHWQPADC